MEAVGAGEAVTAGATGSNAGGGGGGVAAAASTAVVEDGIAMARG